MVLSRCCIPSQIRGCSMKFLRSKLNTTHFGRRGERIAAEFLRRQGYAILAQNYRKRCGEVDIVARDGDTLVFVEVKTRSSTIFGKGYEAVDYRKQRKLTRIAEEYLVRHDLCTSPARFDVISVHLASGGDSTVHHIPNAFESTSL